MQKTCRKLPMLAFLVFFLPQFLGNPVDFQETAVGKTLKMLKLPTLAIFGTFFASYRPPSGKIISYSCRGGHKLRNEWSYIKIRQVLSSEMRKM